MTLFEIDLCLNEKQIAGYLSRLSSIKKNSDLEQNKTKRRKNSQNEIIDETKFDDDKLETELKFHEEKIKKPKYLQITYKKRLEKNLQMK